MRVIRAEIFDCYDSVFEECTGGFHFESMGGRDRHGLFASCEKLVFDKDIYENI